MKSQFSTFLILCLVIFFYACAEKHSNDPKVTASILIASDTTPIAVDTNQYLYDFIKMVEKDQKLDYSYGLTLKPNEDLSTTEDDSYLWRFLKRTSQPIKTETTKNTSLIQDSTQTVVKSDSIKILIPTEPFTISSTVFPNPIESECLTKGDIKYILAEKRRLKNFRWDNQRLGFNLENTNNWYVFSLPYFSKDKKTALICIRSLCKPFLCGDGYVLLYRFENNQWTSTKVDSWIH
ncbi:hypothetical protein [Cytophaga aurantiaca]|uniref:hypothetical protein n=1 Tax=Cytophaga aurantiaca TaxID=29530 RepID=UPI00037F7DBC|nr:hypothetical protein [Cytophaga aurantiaca]